MSKVNVSKVLAKIRTTRSNVERFIALSMVQGMQDFEGRIIERQMSGQKGKKGVNRVSGRLAGDWFIDQRGSGNTFSVTLATPIKYAQIHQRGGTITPKSAKMLAIPLPGAMTQSQAAQGPRANPNLRFIRSKKGNLLLAEIGARGIKPMWILKKSVGIPKRLFVLEDFRRNGSKMIMSRFRSNLSKIKQGAKGGK